MSGKNDDKSRNSGISITGINASGNAKISAGGDIKITIDVAQSIAAMPNTSEDEKEQLKQLFAKLEETLKSVPEQRATDAALVATRSQQLAQEAALSVAGVEGLQNH